MFRNSGFVFRNSYPQIFAAFLISFLVAGCSSSGTQDGTDPEVGVSAGNKNPLGPDDGVAPPPSSPLSQLPPFQDELPPTSPEGPSSSKAKGDEASGTSGSGSLPRSNWFKKRINPKGATSIADEITQAKKLYEQRDLVHPEIIENVLSILQGIEKNAEGLEKYEILILESRALYFKGQYLSRDRKQRMDIHAEGRKKADEAIALTEIGELIADGYYYAGLNLTRWAEAKGLSIIDLWNWTLDDIKKVQGDLLSYLKGALESPTFDNSDGEKLDGYGPDRISGKVKLQFPLIYTRDEAIAHLEKAFENAKHYSLNALFLAEALSTGPQYDKERAKDILKELLSTKGKLRELYSDRFPETQAEMDLAESLLRSLK